MTYTDDPVRDYDNHCRALDAQQAAHEEAVMAEMESYLQDANDVAEAIRECIYDVDDQGLDISEEVRKAFADKDAERLGTLLINAGMKYLEAIADVMAD